MGKTKRTKKVVEIGDFVGEIEKCSFRNLN
jgi:hypothetical protein